MPDYELYTDGSAYPGRKHGGWAFHLLSSDSEITRRGPGLTNDANNMELLAVVNGLGAIEFRRASVVVYTDSLFVIECQTRVHKKYKWMTPLLMQFRELCNLHYVTFIQLHNNRPKEHQLVHHLAREAARDELSVPNRDSERHNG